MADTRLSIRLDLTSGDRIGPGKIALLEAIRSTGSISAAARRLGMSYRRAWLLVEQINDALQEPAVTAAIGGRQGGGAALTPSGERVVELYRSIETIARASAKEEFRTNAARLARHIARDTLIPRDTLAEFALRCARNSRAPFLPSVVLHIPTVDSWSSNTTGGLHEAQRTQHS
jgi:molybdate transport system regulatory protein